MVAVSAKVELSGNFFTHDPGNTLYTNIGKMLDGIAVEMQDATRAQIAAHASEMPFYTGWTVNHTIGRRGSSRKHWALWAAVSPPMSGLSDAEAIRTFAAAAGIERRFHPYRNVKGGAYRSRALISANLAKNLE